MNNDLCLVIIYFFFQSVRVLLGMMTSFAISWLPLEVFSVIKNISPSIIDGTNYGEMLSCILHLLAFSNCASNSVLYFVGDKKFRKGFKMLLLKMTCRTTSQISIHDNTRRTTKCYSYIEMEFSTVNTSH